VTVTVADPGRQLRNDRYIPLHPDLVALLAEWTADNAEYIRAQRHLIATTTPRSIDGLSTGSSPSPLTPESGHVLIPN